MRANKYINDREISHVVNALVKFINIKNKKTDVF